MLKNMKFWLVFSLCLNLLFIGIILGNAFDGGKMRNHSTSRDQVGLIILELPHQLRREIGRDLRNNFSQYNSNGEAITPEQLAIWIAAEPFDPAPFKNMFDANVQRNQEMAKNAQAILIQKLQEMPSEQRQKLAEKIRNSKHGKPRHQKRIWGKN